ncbi:hypothetical protein [Acinetobacter calcoaceticus]|uniref:hypothetical protein n=1 Tax=Acinetobacter calcoaceticus TaxID=471 RepID=UPI0022727349|nr:hypothetical protein [Acinetobacter calcoaceticus]GLG85339.1 hypothetical protein ACSO1_38630 [Acinetobacter calcoaceticus]
MANEQKDLQQKVNQNGRPVSVFTREHLETAANVASESSDILGYLKDGTSVVDNYNFRWGLIHSKNTPLFSKERLEKAREFRFYKENPQTGRIFKGNQHTKVFDTKKFGTKIDKLGSKAGNFGDGVELALAIVDRNPEALATKSSTLVLSKAGEKTGEVAGLAAAGKCAKVAIKRLDPRKATVVGLTCAGAAIGVKYWLKDKGDELGNTVGKTKTAIEAAQGVLDAVDILDQVETKAAEGERQEAIKKDPMVEWHIVGAD